MISPSYCTVYISTTLWSVVFFPWSVIDLFGDQALTAREGSDEEMETNASEESDGVCIIIIIIKHHKKKQHNNGYIL